MPQTRPIDIERNSPTISLAVPCALRKRTRAKVPATASPAPMLPLTIMMTIVTAAGSSASASVNELLWRLRKEKTSAVSTPRTIAVAMQARKEKSVIAGEIRLLNTGYHSVYVFLKDIVSVADAVF